MADRRAVTCERRNRSPSIVRSSKSGSGDPGASPSPRCGSSLAARSDEDAFSAGFDGAGVAALAGGVGFAMVAGAVIGATGAAGARSICFYLLILFCGRACGAQRLGQLLRSQSFRCALRHLGRWRRRRQLTAIEPGKLGHQSQHPFLSSLLLREQLGDEPGQHRERKDAANDDYDRYGSHDRMHSSSGPGDWRYRPVSAGCPADSATGRI